MFMAALVTAVFGKDTQEGDVAGSACAGGPCMDTALAACSLSHCWTMYSLFL